MQDNWEYFIQYLKDNKDMIDPIVYTSALPPYTSHLLKIIDPNREIF